MSELSIMHPLSHNGVCALGTVSRKQFKEHYHVLQLRYLRDQLADGMQPVGICQILRSNISNQAQKALQLIYGVLPFPAVPLQGLIRHLQSSVGVQ